MAKPYDVIVVGAGVAGCVAAERLGAAGHSVLVLDAGPVGPVPASIAGTDPLAALVEPGWTWPLLATDGPLPLIRGRGLGGGSAINGMVLMAGERDDYRRWGGVPLLEHVDAVMQKLDMTSLDDGPLTLAFRRAALADRHPVGGSTGQLDEYGLLRSDLAMADGRRRTAADMFLTAARNVDVVGSAHVLSLDVRGSKVVGVNAEVGGQVQQFRARHVVLAAGAMVSPQLLVDVELGNQHVGSQLRNHPAVAITAELRDTSARGRPATSVLRWSSGSEPGDLLALPLEYVGEATAIGGNAVAAYGGVLAVSMSPSPEVQLSGLRMAVRDLTAMIRSGAFDSAVKGWYIDDEGTGLDGLPENDGELDEWIASHPAGVYHMGCSCPLEAAVGRGGQVFGSEGVSVIDASVLPELPMVNPQVAIMAMASWLAAELAEDLA